MNRTTYNIHSIALTALFMMGNAILAPYIYGFKSTLLSFLVSSVLALLIIAAVSKFLNFVFLPTKKHKIFFYVIAFLVGLLAIFGALDTLYSYIRFLTNIQMPQTSLILICIALAIPVAALVFCSNSALYKFCLLSAIISSLAIVLIFIGGIKYFDFTLFKANPVINQSLTSGISEFLKSFLPAICIAAFMTLTKESACTKQTIIGVSLGLFATAVCLLQSMLTLGVSANQDFPYLKAVSVISSGSLFTRLDGFCFWLFFVCALVKSSVCIKTVWLITKTVIPQKNRKNFSAFFDYKCQ
ncbi:MAG: hypothetical protein IJY79_07050 [Clostridia bacterium]|nr:hypothetical protein [Clostridia bacterium]